MGAGAEPVSGKVLSGEGLSEEALSEEALSGEALAIARSVSIICARLVSSCSVSSARLA